MKKIRSMNKFFTVVVMSFVLNFQSMASEKLCDYQKSFSFQEYVESMPEGPAKQATSPYMIKVYKDFKEMTDDTCKNKNYSDLQTPEQCLSICRHDQRAEEFSRCEMLCYGYAASLKSFAKGVQSMVEHTKTPSCTSTFDGNRSSKEFL